MTPVVTILTGARITVAEITRAAPQLPGSNVTGVTRKGGHIGNVFLKQYRVYADRFKYIKCLVAARVKKLYEAPLKNTFAMELIQKFYKGYSHAQFTLANLNTMIRGRGAEVF